MSLSFPIELNFPLLIREIREFLRFSPSESPPNFYGDFTLEHIQFALSIDPFYQINPWEQKGGLLVKIDQALHEGLPEANLLENLNSDKFFDQPIPRGTRGFPLFSYRKDITQWYIRIYNFLADKKAKEEKEKYVLGIKMGPENYLYVQNGNSGDIFIKGGRGNAIGNGYGGDVCLEGGVRFVPNPVVDVSDIIYQPFPISYFDEIK